MEEATDHHVRFTADTHLDPEPIHILESQDPSLPPEAHVGILKNHHTYRVDIPIPHSLGAAVSARHGEANIHFTVMEPPETVEKEDGSYKYISTVKLQVKTIRDGSISERIFISDSDNGNKGKTLEIMVTAKVMKPNQGNPALKEGVHVISHEHTDDSDFTEWPGHGQDAGAGD